MSELWTAFALFAIPAVGAFVGFDLGFRVTAYRTRQIAREELAAANRAADTDNWSPVFQITKDLMNGGANVTR